MKGLSLVLLAALAGCSKAPDDEAWVRRELGLPAAARLLWLEAEPKRGGTFGREGLRVAAQFELSPDQAAKAAISFRDGGRWRRSFDVSAVAGLPGFPSEGFGGVRPSLVYCWVASEQAGSLRELPCDLAPQKVRWLRYAAFDPQAGRIAAVFKNYF